MIWCSELHHFSMTRTLRWCMVLCLRLCHFCAAYGSSELSHALRTTWSYWMSRTEDIANDEREREREREQSSSAAHVSQTADIVQCSLIGSRCLHRKRASAGCVDRFLSFESHRCKNLPSCHRKENKIMGLHLISEHVGSLFARQAAVRPSSLWWRSAVVVHRWKWARGAEEIINEDTEGSCARGEGQTLAWVRLCPCGDTKDGLLRFLSGDEVAWGCPRKTKSFSLCAGLQRQRKSRRLHDHGWALFVTTSELHGSSFAPLAWWQSFFALLDGWMICSAIDWFNCTQLNPVKVI